MKSIKRISPVLILLCLPGPILLWGMRGVIAAAIAEKDIWLIVSSVAMLPGIYYFILFLVWRGIVGVLGCKRMERRLSNENFHVDCKLTDLGTSLSLWIDEEKGRIAILSNRNPFSGQIFSASIFTNVEIEDKGTEMVLRKLSLKIQADGEPITIILFNIPERTVLRNSQMAQKALSTATSLQRSIQNAVQFSINNLD